MKGICIWDSSFDQSGGIKNPPRHGSGGASGQLWMLSMASLIRPWNKLRGVPGRKPHKNLFMLPMGAMKQAQPSCKHMFTGVGGVKTARVFGRVC